MMLWRSQIIDAVLIIQDNPAQARHLNRLLKFRGTLVAANLSAREIYEKIALRVPDMIMLDFHMREADAADLRRHLESDARTRLVPLVAMAWITAPVPAPKAGPDASRYGSG